MGSPRRRRPGHESLHFELAARHIYRSEAREPPAASAALVGAHRDHFAVDIAHGVQLGVRDVTVAWHVQVSDAHLAQRLAGKRLSELLLWRTHHYRDRHLRLQDAALRAAAR